MVDFSNFQILTGTFPVNHRVFIFNTFFVLKRIFQSAARICKSCCALLHSQEPKSGPFEKRILGVTSRVLPLDKEAVIDTCDSDVMSLFVQYIQVQHTCSNYF